MVYRSVPTFRSGGRKFRVDRDAAERPLPVGADLERLGHADPALGFSDWSEPLTAGAVALEFIASEGIPLPCERATQRRASAYEAAFSVGEHFWPRPCHTFLEHYVPKYEALYQARGAGGVGLSIASELARRSAFVTMRNILRWHAQWCAQGCDPAFQICAFELVNLPTESRRHYPRSDVRLSSVRVEVAGRRGYESDFEYEQLRARRCEAVRRAIDSLDRDGQRVLRMQFGFFPCATAYSSARIASVLGRPLGWVQATYQRSAEEVARTVREQLSA